jgi:lipid II:glycine glycyltransferase (peptidoglycan interpeptide bridge formation enzyme)
MFCNTLGMETLSLKDLIDHQTDLLSSIPQNRKKLTENALTDNVSAIAHDREAKEGIFSHLLTQRNVVLRNVT